MLKHLAEGQPSAVTQLKKQFRMNEEICHLSNDIVYDGALVCANDDVRSRRLELLGYPENVDTLSNAWLGVALNPAMPVVFLDTDAPNTAGNQSPFRPLERKMGSSAGGSIVNDTEASLVRVVVDCLLKCGMKASSIGVICPFRAQLKLMNECPDLANWKDKGLELSTIDRYQGRDKDVIVLSFVRSNEKGKVGRLLEDFRRLNVAVTRAKCKLIMIGSFSTLYNGSSPLRSALDRVKQTGSVVNV
jgi:DNA replication ATP-dependent helicase Dna2